MSESAKFLLGTGAQPASCVTDMNSKLLAQYALGYTLARTTVLASSTVLMWFVQRPEWVSRYLCTTFVLASAASSAAATTAAQTLITTNEATGLFLTDVLILNTSNFALRFDKAMP